MSQTIKIKRSAVPGRQPSVDDLELGELAVNTFDGALFTKINDGFDSVKKLSPDPVIPYTAGTGIAINNHVISSTIKSAGTTIEVQIGDGQGNFSSVPQQPAGRVLTSNGDQPPTWEPVPVSGGTVRNINASGGATGMTFTGGPVTEEGVLTMGGTLAINSGGTGATTVAGAQAALLPAQAGNANRALYTDGSGVLSWEVPPGQFYTAGTGLELVDNEFSSTVANNTGEANRVTISNGDGTLSNLPAGVAGYVLRSSGPGVAPTWVAAGGTVTSIDATSNVVGLTLTGGPITTSGTLTLNGVLSVDNGGTGGVTAQQARTNLLPSQAGRTNVQFLTTDGTDVSWATPLPAQASQSGKFLTTDGTTASWQDPPGSGTVTSVNINGGTTGLTSTGGPITTAGSLTLGGTLAVEHGGTGVTTAAEIQTLALPDQTNQAGRLLITDGTSASWSATVGQGTVTSVSVSGGTTGLTTSGGPVTTNGTIALGGTLNVANGGTGGATAQVARTNLLPSQTDKAGNILVSNGTDVFWSSDVGTGTVTSVDVSGGTTGLTVADGPITAAGTLTLGGTLNIASGGTGQTTAAGARNALLPAQSTNAGKILGTDGTNVSWVTSSAGSVTSVAVDGGTTGLTTSGGPVTSAGTITLGGVLTVANGGTGANNATTAINNLVPSQSGQSGRFLTSNGSSVSWGTAGQGSVTSVTVSGGTTGLTTSGGPVTTTGTITLGGVLNVANGGTGASTVVAARTGLLPNQATHAGAVLVTNGTDVSWSDTIGTGTVTSVGVSGGTTGLTTSGGPVTASGTITLAGTLAVANGGTGATTASDAINALVPSQTGQTGRYLMTNGTVVGWSSAGQGSVTSVNIDGGTTGLTATGGPITSAGTLTLGGRLALANGGTGATSAQQARNNILPEQDTHAGQVLVTNGTDVSWSDTVGQGTVTSVAIDGGSTGLTVAGGPITTNGTMTLGGTLAIANGGTGQTTASAAINALVPSQTGNTGRFLSTNGTTVSWVSSAAGANTQVIYNNAGALAGSANFTFNSGTNTLSTTNLTTSGIVDLTGGVQSTARVVAASSIDCSTGTYFTKAAPTGVLTWTFDNVPVAGKAYIFALALTNGGAFAQTWPTTVIWPSGSAPTLSTGTTVVDLLIFSTSDGGTTWRGSSLLNYAR